MAVKVTAKMVKELRDLTGAGMMDCKKALVETEGDIQAAIDYLREKGMASAAKKADRIAAEGLTDVVIEGNAAVVFELNSETDFVAKNEQFLNLLNTIGEALVEVKPKTVEEALQSEYNGETIEALLVNATSTIGEKLTLRRLEVVEKSDDQVFGSYKHMGGRIGALTVLKGGNEEIAKDVAMHVAAVNPLFLDETSVDADELAREREVLTNEFKNELAEETNEKAREAKEKRLDQIIGGKVSKWLKDICLVDQPYVKDNDVTVQQFVSSNDAEVLHFVRYEVGEGIEKKEENFAEEVKAQVRG